ncbi:MAG: YeeE/YedE family protein [Hyphomicrobiaceae bacterium]
MDLSWLAEQLGDAGTATLGGLVVGLAFGVFAQRSQFCLRSATIEFWRGSLGPKTAIWLLTFATALIGTQVLFAAELLDQSTVRQLTTVGTLSGAVLGGLMFGAGMILARGCASRLLVLSATGNLRALITGLIVTLVAQASLRGALSPVRLHLSSYWLVEPETRNLLGQLPDYAGLMLGIAILVVATALAWRQLAPGPCLTAIGVGAAVVAGWWFNATLSGQAFDIVPVQSISFTGPSTDTLMALVDHPEPKLSFGLGLVPGVFIGSLLAASVAGEFRLQSFGADAPMPRYILGACLMGFGSMLAGGCAVGAGVSGGAVMALTAWIALTAMWLAAGVTDLFVDNRAALAMYGKGASSGNW